MYDVIFCAFYELNDDIFPNFAKHMKQLQMT